MLFLGNLLVIGCPISLVYNFSDNYLKMYLAVPELDLYLAESWHSLIDKVWCNLIRCNLITPAWFWHYMGMWQILVLPTALQCIFKVKSLFIPKSRCDEIKLLRAVKVSVLCIFLNKTTYRLKSPEFSRFLLLAPIGNVNDQTYL